MCARASAFRSSNSVRRRTTSRRNSMKCSRMSMIGRTRGRPATIASMMMPKRRLQLGVLVEIVEDDLRNLAAAQLDHDAHAVAVGLVAKVGDALDGLLAHQLGDLLEQPGLVDLIRDLGDDDGELVALLALLDLDARPAS